MFLLKVLANGDPLVMDDALFEPRGVSVSENQCVFTIATRRAWGVTRASSQKAKLTCTLGQ
ncbi:MAG: hypothetical protein ABI247_10735 [Rhodanobacter sp.]